MNGPFDKIVKRHLGDWTDLFIELNCLFLLSSYELINRVKCHVNAIHKIISTFFDAEEIEIFRSATNSCKSS